MKIVYNLYKKNSNNKVIQVIFLFDISVNINIYSIALSVTADASDASSLKNAFNTIRKSLGTNVEVLLYNAGGFVNSKLNILFIFEIFFRC